ncbi:MAG: class I SAM-dependent methyltransferase, partial [Pirellulaceae bacterium]|nr:class I SAM-dependent methyltransferase [Pirellulaceae bacterium]
QKLADLVQGKPGVTDLEHHYDHIAATQWIHTPSAIQAAEILNIGGEGEVPGPKILDLGGGSAVWSCAMAHKDAAATITVVDHQRAIDAARVMAESIGLAQRFDSIAGNPISVELPEAAFDLVLIAQRMNALGAEAAGRLLGQAIGATRSGGRIVVIDLFRGPAKPNLAECVEALKLELDTSEGKMRDLKEAQKELADAGLTGVQFTFLAASRVNMGLMVAVKPAQ